MASSSSCANNKSYKYDVFLSFSGEDTRKTFVDHFYAALEHRGICTFKDDERLEKGKAINDELLKAIEDSRVYIIVFSKNYASSSWCLNELLKIMECRKTNRQNAFPVFYDVDPSEVRKQTGSVGKALAIHTHKNESEVGEWREALREAANLSGWDLRKTADGHEAKAIKLIIEKVSLELRPTDMNLDESLVGMEQRMQDLDSCLEIGLYDVRMIGIKGMGGSGKTTLARSIFDKISFKFDGQSFVENVREKASRLGLEKLQEQVLRDVLKNKDITVSDVHEGKILMKKMMRSKKVFVVLDDVDRKDQLEKLACDTSWFAPGTRVIITTRDGQLLVAHRVKWIRDVSLLSKEEAIRLFNRHAFGKDKPTKEFEKHSQEVLRYAAGLPLTIKVLGSDLCGKDDSEWADSLKRLKTIPLKETLKILELSYENLEDDYKEIFLDVACFLQGWKKDDAIRMLESSGFYAKSGLRVLEQKSLITISKDTYSGETIITMHDHLIEMGKNIVRREHPDEPHKHSRLWVLEEIEQVMSDNSGSEAARCIDLEITPSIFLEGLGNMKKLRCLIVNDERKYMFSHDCVKIDEARRYFPNSLRYLYWYEYPHWCLPKMFEANNLVALELPKSKIEQLWEGGKVMKKLKFLDLSRTKLRSLDLGLTPKLESLNLQFCTDLVKLHVHGGCLKSLVYLNLGWCERLKSISFIEKLESLEVVHIDRLNLREYSHIFTGLYINSLLEIHLSFNGIEEIPSSIGNFRKLVSLHLVRCGRINSLPGSICSLQHLTTLDLDSTGIEQMPEELGQLEYLEYLDLGYTKLKHLPGSICMLKRLKTLILRWCRLLEKLPDDVGEIESLEQLDLQLCFNLREIPSSICKLKRLRALDLEGCKSLEKLPEDIGGVQSLEILDLHCCINLRDIPSSISNLKHLKKLKLEGCKRLEKLPDLGCLQLLDIKNTDITHRPNITSLIKVQKTGNWDTTYRDRAMYRTRFLQQCKETVYHPQK
ncbi:TMV resistance protein N-like [Bidens hawaiensis]|uniref:TMV resistance protein N-like n=1 Tax=Bidens hawaiensis TaxID=980011 RepID=UPI004048F5D7